MRIKDWIAACGLAVSQLSQPSMAGPLEDGLAAFQHGDYSTALRYYRPLADQGNAEAQYNLGFAYTHGQGVPQDFVEALKWYRLAAEQENAAAQLQVGFAYDRGQGVLQDSAEALKWYRLAAKQGDATAQFALGATYFIGKHVSRDYIKAHMWFNLAAAGYLASETQMRDSAVGYRDEVAKQMTPEQLAEAQRLAREWMAANPKQ